MQSADSGQLQHGGTSDSFSPQTLQQAMLYRAFLQSPGQQGLLIQQQMENLQRLVEEQNKLIALMNPGLALSPVLSAQLLGLTSGLFPTVEGNSTVPLNGLDSKESPESTQNLTSSLPSETDNNIEAVESAPSCSQTDENIPENDNVQTRHLSPIKEESAEQGEQICPVSPFGIRRRRSVHPEDRPIRPIVGVKKKTFEEFVEEQLKVDEEVLEKEKQELKECKESGRKNFLRKGEGISRIEKTRFNALRERRRASLCQMPKQVNFVSQHRRSLPTLQDSDTVGLRKMTPLNSQVSSPAMMEYRERSVQAAKADAYSSLHRTAELEQRVGKTTAAQSGLKDNTNKNNTGKRGVLDQTPGKRRTWRSRSASLSSLGISDTVGFHSLLGVAEKDSHSSPWTRQGAEQPLAAQAPESAAALRDGRQSTETDKMGPGPEFKKVNDRIVRVSDGADLSTHSGGEKSVIRARCGAGREIHTWRTEEMQFQPPSSTGDSTSSEVDPKSQCHEQPTHQAPLRLGHTDRNLDLSEDDYASDAPSGGEEAASRPQTPHRFSLLHQISSSSSTSTSDSSSDELRSYNWHKKAVASPQHRSPKKELTDKRRTPFLPGNDSSWKANIKPPSTSELVASLFPGLKTREKDTSQSKETGVSQQPEDNQYENPRHQELKAEMDHSAVLDKLKEEQEKALQFLRKKMTGLEQENGELVSLRNNSKEGPILKNRAVVSNPDIEELKELKEQMKALQEELKQREDRWSAAHGQLTSQVVALTRENVELRDELKVSEKHRQEAWRSHDMTPRPSRKADTPVSEAILIGTCQLKSEDRPASCSGRSGAPVGRKLQFERPLSSKPEVKAIQHISAEVQRAKDRRSPFLSQHVSAGTEVSSTCGHSSHSASSEDPHNPDNHDSRPQSRSRDRGLSRSGDRQLTVTGRQSRSATPSGRGTPSTGKTTESERRFQETRGQSGVSRGVSPYTGVKGGDDEVVEETHYPDGKKDQLFSSGRRVITFRNATRKEIGIDGKSVTVTFFNGDIKKVLSDEKVIYFYADAQTTHTTYPNGLEVLQFPNNQIEKHHPNGTKEIVFPDQTVKHLYPDGREESVFPDGTVVKLAKNGEKTVEFSNGQREIHTSQYKRREYPDGTVKTVYSNGRQETKYSTGRVRIKDREGSIIMDKK
ncbi:centromere protein J isoform X2 [Amia ocellicauda]|uniref:centromere protein J isoform X2 n=1 Tax=Amia ocellicauda TaxID=2972642 RepID=UPI0034646E33